MIHVARLTDRTGGYYLADLAGELGPAMAGGRRPGTPAPGTWVGAGSRALGLQGAVDAAGLAAVLSGRAPGGGRPLVGGARRVAGFDACCTAPKSVSVLWALGPPDVAAAVLAAHAEAVDGALGYLSARALSVRRWAGGERLPLATGGVIGAAFTHGVSRAADPHLHTHLVVANLAHAEDGRWGSLDGRGLYAHARAAGALYACALRRGLAERLGVEWAAGRHGQFELAGIDPSVLGGVLGSGGGDPGPPGRAPAGRCRGRWDRRCRGAPPGWPGPPPGTPRGPGTAPRSWPGRWAERAAAVGLSGADLGAVLGRTAPSPGCLDEHRFAAAVSEAPGGAPARRDAVGAWAGALAGGAPAAEVEACVDRLANWDGALGVAEAPPCAGRRGAAGPPPAGAGPAPGQPPPTSGTWQRGAAAIDGYRARWGVTDRGQALGAEGSGRSLQHLPAARLADHLATERSLAGHPPPARPRRAGAGPARPTAPGGSGR